LMDGEALLGREGGSEGDLERTGRMGPASMGMGTRRGVFLPDSSRDGERREKRGRKVGRPAEWLMSDRLAWLALTAKRSTCLPPRSAIDHYHQTKNSFRPRRDAPDCPVSLSACLLPASGVPCAVPASVAATASPSSVPASPSRLPVAPPVRSRLPAPFGCLSLPETRRNQPAGCSFPRNLWLGFSE
jgi:hypothetical protein